TDPDQGEGARAGLDGAGRAQRRSVSRGEPQLRQALDGQDREVQDEPGGGHEARPASRYAPSTARASTYSAEKPGPSAATSARSPDRIVPRSRKRSRTNRHDGDDMFPNSRSTSRAWSSDVGGRSSVSA